MTAPDWRLSLCSLSSVHYSCTTQGGVLTRGQLPTSPHDGQNRRQQGSAVAARVLHILQRYSRLFLHYNALSPLPTPPSWADPSSHYHRTQINVKLSPSLPLRDRRV